MRYNETGQAMAFDALDNEIIARLKADPQISNKQIAKETDSSEATISARLKVLFDTDAIRIVAQKDIEFFGMPLVAHVDIFVTGGGVNDIAEQLAGIEDVSSVVVLAGAPQIIIQVNTKDLHSLRRLLSQDVGKINGIEKVETHIALDILNYKTDIANIQDGEFGGAQTS